MRKTWLLPIFITVILIVLWVNRWEYTATKTTNYKIIKWKTDHWTGQVWMETYKIQSFAELADVKIEPMQPLVSKDPKKTETNYTIMWIVSLGINALWLLIVTPIDKKKENNSIEKKSDSNG